MIPYFSLHEDTGTTSAMTKRLSQYYIPAHVTEGQMLRLTSLFLFLTLLFSCESFFYERKEVKLTELSNTFSQSIYVETPSRKAIHKLLFKVEGNVSDTCFINGKEILPGEIDTVFYDGDYYENSINLDYYPLNSNEGFLNVEFRFYYYP